jgi:hypothetical protein
VFQDTTAPAPFNLLTVLRSFLHRDLINFLKMSGHPQGAQYEDGYTRPQGGQEQDSYYQDEQYGQYHDDQNQQRGQPGYQDQAGDAYYDESYVDLKDPLLAPLTYIFLGHIMTVSQARLRLRAKDSISKRDIMTIAVNSPDINKTNITTINITTKAVRSLGMIKTGMCIF